MSLKQRIEDDLKAALRAGDKQRLGCLRMVKAKAQEKQIELRGKKGREAELSDDDVLDVVSAYAKQRHDSIESYERGGREDLAARERAELEILAAYSKSLKSTEALRGGCHFVAEIVTKSLSYHRDCSACGSG